jgi:hypothetical protein
MERIVFGGTRIAPVEDTKMSRDAARLGLRPALRLETPMPTAPTPPAVTAYPARPVRGVAVAVLQGLVELIALARARWAKRP